MNPIKFLYGKYLEIERTVLEHQQAEADRAYARLYKPIRTPDGFEDLAEFLAVMNERLAQLTAVFRSVGVSAEEASGAFRRLGKLIQEAQPHECN